LEAIKVSTISTESERARSSQKEEEASRGRELLLDNERESVLEFTLLLELNEIFSGGRGRARGRGQATLLALGAALSIAPSVAVTATISVTVTVTVAVSIAIIAPAKNSRDERKGRGGREGKPRGLAVTLSRARARPFPRTHRQ